MSSIDNGVQLFSGDCLTYLNNDEIRNVALTFIDPPFRQGKEYRYFDDDQPEEHYWKWMEEVLSSVYTATIEGGAVYFMQREKNAEDVLRVIKKSGWIYQNLIIWKKMTSAVPSDIRFGKQYQIIVFATKGHKPRVFNKLRVDLPMAPAHRYSRPNGVFLTDVWDDIRELTSGYFAGDEAIRVTNGERAHTQQSPIALLLRIILSSSVFGDTVFDPFAGSGTAAVVASQLNRRSIGIEIDPNNIDLITNRLREFRPADSIAKFRHYYRFTRVLDELWKPSDQVQGALIYE